MAAPSITTPYPRGVCDVRNRHPPHSRTGVWTSGIQQFAEESKSSSAPGASTTVDTVATTTFVEEGIVEKVDFSRTILTDELTSEMISIKDFLAKPQRVATITWTTARLQNDVLGTWRVGETLLANPYWMNKIQGFGLVRGRVVLRVQLTANPFQQGKVLTHFLPCEKDFSAIDVSYVPMHNACIAAKRQQPCVELDCRDTVAILEMPYIAPSSWFNVKTGAYDWGTFIISVLSPLATGAAGESAVELTVYMSFEDFELTAPLVPQSGGDSVKKKFKSKAFSADQAAEELKNLQKGTPISSALKFGATVAGALGEIPVLSAIAKPAEWVLDAASGVAGWFGWAKPMNNVSSDVTALQYARYSATCDGVSNALPVSLRCDNKTSVTDKLSIRDHDEMSFDFLKSVETLIDTVDWTTGNLSGTSLYTKEMRPALLYQAGTTTAAGHTAAWRCGPPIYYLANTLKLWRGGINVTIKIVKTDFHTGRLQLTWTPGVATPVAPNLDSSLLSMREIIDIREGSEFTFKLPYMIATNYIDNTTSSGRLDVLVLNELRVPETAAGSVQLLMYYSGADDFEMQAPGWDAVSQYNLPFSPQSGEIASPELIGDVTAGPVTTEFAEQSIGECFTSVKQLYSRNSFTYIRASPAGAGNGLLVWPWFASVPYVNATTGALAGANVGGDIYSLLSPLYAFYKGSAIMHANTAYLDTGGIGRNAVVNATLIPVDPVATAYKCLQAQIAPDGLQVATDYLTSRTMGSQGVAYNQAGIGMIDVKVPYMARTKCSLLVRQTNSDNIPVEHSQPLAALNMNCHNGFINYSLARSFGDEFQTMYFIGCPPRFISYV